MDDRSNIQKMKSALLSTIITLRLKPKMYLRSTDCCGFLNLLAEWMKYTILDECCNNASMLQIKVSNGIVVEYADNGRGIPILERGGKNKIEDHFQIIYSGGRINKNAYERNGSLFCFAPLLVAYSRILLVQTVFEQKGWEMEFANQTLVKSMPFQPAWGQVGTKITFQPDRTIFQIDDLTPEQVVNYLKSEAQEFNFESKIEFTIVR